MIRLALTAFRMMALRPQGMATRAHEMEDAQVLNMQVVLRAASSGLFHSSVRAYLQL
jgi:hypothetical protein